MAFNLFSKNSPLFPQEKKQQKLLMILAGLILITFIIFYFGFLRPPASIPFPDKSVPSIKPIDQSVVSAGEIINKIDFDISFLKEPNFRALKTYGEWPIKIEEKGRQNPFLPY